MPQHVDLILTLTGALTAALVFGLLARGMGLSPIVGYLVAGIAVGPFTPGVVVNRELAEQLAELGVVVLMFGVGLHFRAKDLFAARSVALPGALVQVAVATVIGAAVALLAGWSAAGSVVFGLAISVASTVLLTRVLADHDALHTLGGRIAVGWLLVEDLITVMVLVVLPALAESGAGDATDLVLSLAAAAVKMALLVAFVAVSGKRVIPALLRWVAKMRSRELFTLTLLVLVLGVAVVSAVVFGASMALGAFLAGMVVAQSQVSARAASEALPMRDAFAVLFFVSAGMLFDPTAVLPNLPLVLAAIAVVVLAKPATAYLLMRVLGRPHGVAMLVAVALGQIGEFSFVLAGVGTELGLVPREGLQVVVAAAIVSIAINPVAFRLLVARRAPSHAAGEAQHPVIVVGYDAVGSALVRLLREHGFEPTVIELNLQLVRSLQRDGVRAVHGDGSQREVLERAGVRRASGVLVAASGGHAGAVCRGARAVRPEVTVLVRRSDLEDQASGPETGAHIIDAAETESAVEMMVRLLDQFGAAADQLDRLRARLPGERATSP